MIEHQNLQNFGPKIKNMMHLLWVAVSEDESYNFFPLFPTIRTKKILLLS